MPESVPFACLDTWCRANVLKMDAQGAELAFLQGAVGLRRSRALPLVFLEVNYYEEMALFPSVYQFLYDLRRATLSRPLGSVSPPPGGPADATSDPPDVMRDVRLIDAR